MATRPSLRRAFGWTAGVLGLVLGVVLGTAVTIRLTRDEEPPPTPDEGVPRPALRDCPEGDPSWTRKRPDDGRVYGGALSFTPVDAAGFGDPAPVTDFSWWYDAHGQTADRTTMAVGAVAIEPGVHTPAEAARTSMLCLVGTDGYHRYSERTDVNSRKATVDEVTGWELITDVYEPGRRDAGLRITVITVDAGPPGSFSIFLGITPVDDSAHAKIISAVADRLHCEA